MNNTTIQLLNKVKKKDCDNDISYSYKFSKLPVLFKSMACERKKIPSNFSDDIQFSSNVILNWNLRLTI